MTSFSTWPRRNEGTIDAPGWVEILLGDGSGGFTAAPQQVQAGTNAISLDVGEFNGDGHVDLVVANHGSGDVTVLLGAGDGTFSASGTYPVWGSPACAAPDGVLPDAVKVGFFNADARPDIVVANSGCNTVAVLLGQAGGTFGVATNFAANTGPDALAAADVNRDGNLDVIAPNAASAGATVLLGHGDGTLSKLAAPVFTHGTGLGFTEVAAGDLNGDGNPDLVFATGDIFTGGYISVSLGHGDGTFGTVFGVPLGDATTSVALADLNADSVLDIVTTDDLSGSVYVLPGTGTGAFASEQTFTVPGANWVTVGNVDADPRPDLATADIGSTTQSSVTALINTTTAPGPKPGVGVAAGGSCTPDGDQGTVSLALSDEGEAAGAPALSLTSSNPGLLPTSAVTLGGSGLNRTLTVRPVKGRTGTAVVTVNRLSGGRLVGSVAVSCASGATAPTS